MTARAGWRPLPEARFDRAAAAHLARRAGFGALPEELDRLVEMGLEAAVASFVDFPAEEPALDAAQREHGTALDDLEQTVSGAQDAVARLRVQWLWRMVATAHPLRERLALLWHDHFATAESKVIRVGLLREQYRTFQRLGAGSFRELLGAVARDPAMLVYLDNRVSKKKHPNENFARELFELFSLGIHNYTQRDVAEAARVFTGWTTKIRDEGPFVFDPAIHDANDKLVLGQSIPGRGGAAGEREGDELLDVVARREECARFVATKLGTWFVAHEPPAELVDELAASFTAHGTSIRETLRDLFRSERFYAEEHRFRLYKNPVDWAVSAARLVGLSNAHLLGLDGRLARMGMKLFEPPSVAGWETGRSWIQSSLLAQRYELALALASIAHSRRTVFGAAAADFDALAGGVEEDAGRLCDRLGERFLQRPLAEGARAVVVEHLELDAPLAPGAAASARRERTRALVHLLLCSPEFALA